MPVSTGDIVKLTVNMRGQQGQVVQNVYYCSPAGTISPIDYNTFMANAATFFGTAYNNFTDYVSDDFSFLSLSGYNLTQDEPIAEVPWTGNVDGNNTGEYLPSQTAALVTFGTGVKRSVGRKFIAGLTEVANSTIGEISATVQGFLEDFATDILTGFTSGGETIEIGNYRVSTQEFFPYITAIVDAIWSTQRRRKTGTGI